MKRNNHTDFILTPISKILSDAVTACSGIGDGIETYPVCDYIMQSVFLKMTGAQEQKMKCICWEMATDDYDFRRKYLNNEDKLGECSSLADKNKVYIRLLAQISKLASGCNVVSKSDKEVISRAAPSEIKQIFDNSNLATWASKSYLSFISDTKLIQDKHFATEKELLGSPLKEKYEMLYNHRNRCAHNTLSYQQNLPVLKTLVSADYRHDNYFVRFVLLILIDKIFIYLYNRYLEVIEDCM